MTAAAIERLVLDAAIGMEVRGRSKAGLHELGERADLEPVIATAWQTSLADKRVEIGYKTTIPCWECVGRVDVRVRPAQDSNRLDLAAELKWCRTGQMYEAIWDLFKMALLALREDVGPTYLITGAPAHRWTDDPCRDIFENRIHEPIELFARRFSSPTRRLMWDAALEGGYDCHPDAVPARIRTAVIADEPIEHHAGDWAIRAVEVTPLEGLIPIRGGWPNGERPADASRPAPKA